MLVHGRHGVVLNPGRGLVAAGRLGRDDVFCRDVFNHANASDGQGRLCRRCGLDNRGTSCWDALEGAEDPEWLKVIFGAAGGAADGTGGVACLETLANCLAWKCNVSDVKLRGLRRWRRASESGGDEGGDGLSHVGGAWSGKCWWG